MDCDSKPREVARKNIIAIIMSRGVERVYTCVHASGVTFTCTSARVPVNGKRNLFQPRTTTRERSAQFKRHFSCKSGGAIFTVIAGESAVEFK